MGRVRSRSGSLGTGFGSGDRTLAADVIAEARRRASEAGAAIEFRRAPIEALTPEGDAAELIVCCEVLEHLADPERGLAVLASLARPWLLVSVPREPLWRVLNVARGTLLGRAWATRRDTSTTGRAAGSSDWLSARLTVVEVRAPLPWTMALCRA